MAEPQELFIDQQGGLPRPLDLSDYHQDEAQRISLNGGIFHGDTQYGVYDRDVYLPQLERVCKMVGDMATRTEIDQTMAFAERAFGLYDGTVEPDNGGSHVFLIPTFVQKDAPVLYNTQIASSLPIAPYLSPGTLSKTIKGIPPCIIDSYPVDKNGNQGHVVFAPILPDMLTDLPYPQSLETARSIINDAARFGHDRLGAGVAGLGAILPLIVNLGAEVNVEGLTPTTGHGGTVHLHVETTNRVVEEKGLPNNTIAIVGARGSIGRADLAVALERFPDAKFVINDTAFDDPNKLRRFLESFSETEQARIEAVADLDEVFSRAKVVMSAITGTIDVSNLKNLEDVTIIDDSQPGAFDPIAVEAKGGKVVWVVGQDFSKDGKLTRQGTFRFGDAGLMRAQDVFGCEAEAASVYNLDRNSAVRSRVTPDIAKRIGELFAEYEIGVTDMPQSFGRAVLL